MHQTKLIQKPSLDIFQASIIGDSAEFGEYNIATKINGVDSKFAENIDIQPVYGTSLELIPIINNPELQSNIQIIEDNSTFQNFESPIIEANEFQNNPGIQISIYQIIPIIDQELV